MRLCEERPGLFCRSMEQPMTLFDEYADMLDSQCFHGVADAVIILRNVDSVVTKQRIDSGLQLVLADRGNLLLMPNDRNTAAEANRCLGLAMELMWRDIVIVTHQSHHYRAFLTFVKAFEHSGVRIISQPIKQAEMYLYDEVRKISEYQRKGDVASYEEGIQYLNDHQGTT
jgi:hypothetical protein